MYVGPSDKGYSIQGPLTVPEGVRLLGTFAGARKGFQSDAIVSHAPRGSTLLVSQWLGDLITLKAMATIQGIEIYYPYQKTVTSPPDVYGWAIRTDPNGLSHTCSILDVCLVNAYQGIFISAGGGRVDNVWGYCIFRGIMLGRCPDIVIVTNCEFNRNAWEAVPKDSPIDSWTRANGRAYTIDGAEQFMFSNCFCWGYLVGCTFEDVDLDEQPAAGSWIGGGFDTVAVGILVASGLGMTGCKFQGLDIVPTDCAIKCDDSPPLSGTPPQADDNHRPRIMIDGMTVHAAPPVGPYGRAVWVTPTSWCRVIWTGGFAIDYNLEMVKIESPYCVMRMFGIDGSSQGYPRISNPAGADITETGAII